jgi:lipoate-protein ligase A
MSAGTLRVIDTGSRHGRFNIALDQALIEAHRDGTTPDTLRFLEFSPSALVGRHQDLSNELDLEFCREHDIDIGRRITGGGAIYLDQHQLGWELICSRRAFGDADLGTIAATICGAAADALSSLGVDARYRPRNDIEVDGRKISGTGGFYDGDTLFYQGTLIMELDSDLMFGALNVPQSKRDKHDLGSAAARVTSLAACARSVPDRASVKRALTASFETMLNFNAAADELSAGELSLAQSFYDDEIGTPAFVHDIDGVSAEGSWSQAELTTPGGTIEATVSLAPSGIRRMAQIYLSGDFFITPPRIIYDLESRLRDVPTTEIAEVVRGFFSSRPVDLMSLSVEDFVTVIERAIAMQDPA